MESLSTEDTEEKLCHDSLHRRHGRNNLCLLCLLWIPARLFTPFIRWLVRSETTMSPLGEDCQSARRELIVRSERTISPLGVQKQKLGYVRTPLHFQSEWRAKAA